MYFKCRTYLGPTDTSWNIILLSSSKTFQHPLLPGDGLPRGLIKKSLSCSDSSVPLACLCHLLLVYEVLFCFDRSFSCLPLFFSWHARDALPDVILDYLFLRRCLGNISWRASSLKVTSAMTLTCRRRCSFVGRSSSRTRSLKRTRHRWTYSSRRLGRESSCLHTYT